MEGEAATKRQKKMPPMHPGEVLLEDFLKPLGISQYRLAKDLHTWFGSPTSRGLKIVLPQPAIRSDTITDGWTIRAHINSDPS